MATVQKENKVFDKTIITLETQFEHNFIYDLIDDVYKNYEKGSKERDFLIRLSNSFCGCE